MKINVFISKLIPVVLIVLALIITIVPEQRNLALIFYVGTYLIVWFMFSKSKKITGDFKKLFYLVNIVTIAIVLLLLGGAYDAGIIYLTLISLVYIGIFREFK